MERLKKYLPYLLYSCKKISELIDTEDEFLTSKEKLILLYHGTLCRTCHHYKTQSKIIDGVFLNAFKDNGIEPFLSEEKKQEIIKMITDGKL